MYRPGDVEKALLRLGIPSDRVRDELLGICPMHFERTGKQDHNPSWSINEESGVHHCFSCGYKGTLLTLVAETQEFKTEWGRLDLDAAKSWLRVNIEINFELLSRELEELKNAYTVPTKVIEMSEARLAVFSEPPQWALDARGLTAEACSLYTVKWDASKEAWITPIRHADTGKLLGWQEKGQRTKSFRNRPTGVVKSSTVFGLPQRSDVTLVVESPLDVVRLASIGLRGISTFGASVSAEQYALFPQDTKLILAFDNPHIDKAGEMASRKAYAATRAQGVECWFFNYSGLGDVKDVGDMTEEQIQWGIDNALHCVYGEGAIYGKR